jgi:diaminopimelate epimerase
MDDLFHGAKYDARAAKMPRMKIAFTKMHGLGNDFVVIDGTRRPFRPSPGAIRRLADRYRGIGFDQLLVVEPASVPDADFDYRIYNADGGEAGVSGNGARCFARFLRERGLWSRDEVRLRTITTRLTLTHQRDGQVRVDVGAPRFEPADIPFTAPARAPRYTLTLEEGGILEVGAVSMGNPHAVIEVADVAQAPVAALGAALQRHRAFPESVNVQFLQFVAPHVARLRIYERGAGETQASGSGACAAAVVGCIWGKLSSPVTMQMQGGALTIEWGGEGQPVFMTGPAATVYEGTLEWEGEWEQT